MNRTPTTVPRHSDTPQPPSTTIRVLRTIALVGSAIGFVVAVAVVVTAAFGLFCLAAHWAGVAVYALAPGLDPDPSPMDVFGAGLMLLMGVVVLVWPLVLLTIDAWKESRDPL